MEVAEKRLGDLAQARDRKDKVLFIDARASMFPKTVQRLADKNFALLKENPNHASLHFKRVDQGNLLQSRLQDLA